MLVKSEDDASDGADGPEATLLWGTSMPGKSFADFSPFSLSCKQMAHPLHSMCILTDSKLLFEGKPSLLVANFPAFHIHIFDTAYTGAVSIQVRLLDHQFSLLCRDLVLWSPEFSFQATSVAHHLHPLKDQLFSIIYIDIFESLWQQTSMCPIALELDSKWSNVTLMPT